MLDTAITLQRLSYALHAICLVAIVALTMTYPKTMPIIIVVGTLIGLASVATVEHRFVPLFISFGLMFAPTFWVAVSAVNQRLFLELIPAVLLIIGVAWTLQQPGWIPAGFSAAAVIFLLITLRFAYLHRFQSNFSTPEQIVQSLTINSVMNIMSLLELLMGVGIAKTAPYKKKRRKRTDKIAIPTDR